MGFMRLSICLFFWLSFLTACQSRTEGESGGIPTREIVQANLSPSDPPNSTSTTKLTATPRVSPSPTPTRTARATIVFPPELRFPPEATPPADWLSPCDLRAPRVTLDASGFCIRDLVVGSNLIVNLFGPDGEHYSQTYEIRHESTYSYLYNEQGNRGGRVYDTKIYIDAGIPRSWTETEGWEIELKSDADYLLQTLSPLSLTLDDYPYYPMYIYSPEANYNPLLANRCVSVRQGDLLEIYAENLPADQTFPLVLYDRGSATLTLIPYTGEVVTSDEKGIVRVPYQINTVGDAYLIILVNPQQTEITRVGAVGCITTFFE